MPHVRLATGQLDSHQIEHAGGIDADICVLAPDSKQRAYRLRSDVGQRILGRHQQSIDHDLRSADREHSGQPSSYDHCPRWIEQRVDQRAAVHVSDELQRVHGGGGNRALAEQWNHMRQERAMNRIPRIEHTSNAVLVARLQCHDLQHVSVGSAQIRSCRLLLHLPALSDLETASTACRVPIASASSRV
jgi:hypothetical protein